MHAPRGTSLFQAAGDTVSDNVTQTRLMAMADKLREVGNILTRKKHKKTLYSTRPVFSLKLIVNNER